jgi:mono/diheme cytochrome c family protein
MMQRPAVLLISCLALAGAASAAEPPPDGARLYQLNCQLCHGPEGKAVPGFAKKGAPNLNDPAWQKTKTDDEIKKAIEKGSAAKGSAPKVMRSFKDDLNPEQIAAIVKYVRTLPPAAAQ